MALFAALIALVVMMIAAVALIRSTDTAQQIAGNLAIKRDMTHESELAVRDVLALFTGTASLSTETARQGDISSIPYFASVLASNQYGIPTTLVNASTSTGETAASTGMTYRYVIDRMCPATGSSLNAHCVIDPNQEEKGSQAIDAYQPLANGGTGTPGSGGVTGESIVYRISIRVTEARGAQSFFQATLSVPNGGI